MFKLPGIPHATDAARLVVVAVAFAGSPAVAQTLKSGEQVYTEVCAVCHATGVSGAPKFADKAAWKPLVAEGQHVLTAHAWVGVRAMPPRGGRPDLSLEEFSRATAYMARAAGAKWKDPTPKVLARIQKEEKQRIHQMKEGEKPKK